MPRSQNHFNNLLKETPKPHQSPLGPGKRQKLHVEQEAQVGASPMLGDLGTPPGHLGLPPLDSELFCSRVMDLQGSGMHGSNTALWALPSSYCRRCECTDESVGHVRTCII